ncbi:MAG: hypothetical protein F6J89_18075 [Symploca sp. SIO1C4]|uniref:Uncharacterized protein n=1 Tax=Symploca sp. SIO1C4 TaxID=2607765 RepID=A0A6B3NEW8_9CYAN|nr:hypothetical protein [Symploca sp. SIO1C4]
MDGLKKLLFRVNGIYCRIEEIESPDDDGWGEKKVVEVFQLAKEHFEKRENVGKGEFWYALGETSVETLGFATTPKSVFSKNVKRVGDEALKFIPSPKQRQLTEKKNLVIPFVPQRSEGEAARLANVPLSQEAVAGRSPNNYLSYVWQYYVGKVFKSGGKKFFARAPKEGQPLAYKQTIAEATAEIPKLEDLDGVTCESYSLDWRMTIINGSCPSESFVQGGE